MTIKQYVINEIYDYFRNTGEVHWKIKIDYARELIENMNRDGIVIDDEYTPAIIKKIWNDTVTELKKAGCSILWRVHIRLYDDEWSQHIRHNFRKPERHNCTKYREYKCILDISALDENDCVYYRVTTDSEDHCCEEFDGQLTDGTFENCSVIDYEEIENTLENKFTELGV